jgi:hypothetical protein
MSDLSEATRSLRLVSRKLARLLLLVPGIGPDPEGNQWFRASGLVECEVCGQQYQDHVEHPLAPWLTVTCSGKLVKL